MNTELAIKTETHMRVHQHVRQVKAFSPVQLIEMPETKTLIKTGTFDEDLSEFERARRASKTWSMGQD